METEQLQALAQVVLPTEILKYYEVSGVEQSETEIHIHLDERMQDSMKRDKRYESKGFMEEVSVTHLPILDHQVDLLIRKRRWVHVGTGKSFTVSAGMDLTAAGPRYSKEFGAFLKETYGDVPGDLPYA